ncbi:MAG: bacterial extracellular solute-binding protein [Marinobacter excellens HL-55]|uniref:Bacterial extracellular solute-binding protein n=1 Tax=Marinobacter excellens HL-55 TaxID=1305731 RepID=A0A0N8KKX7_9GAMM|nr:MAG: bacterial extracellular solute-binding protein [Marinobacter excellens HL-55]
MQATSSNWASIAQCYSGPALRKSAWILLSVLYFSTPSFADCNITMRWDNDPPYFMGRNDQVVGIDADLGLEAMERLGCNLVFKKLPWARALRELREGRVDMLSGAYRTAEREQYARYSSVVGLVSPNILFIRQDEQNSFNATSLTELLDSGFKLGAQINVSYSEEYSALLQNPEFEKNIEFLSRRESLWKMLARDRIGGVIASKLTG